MDYADRKRGGSVMENGPKDKDKGEKARGVLTPSSLIAILMSKVTYSFFLK